MAKVQEVKDLAVAHLAQAVEDEKKEQWRVEARQMLFDAKRVSKIRILEAHDPECKPCSMNSLICMFVLSWIKACFHF